MIHTGYETLPTPPRRSSEKDRLVELARKGIGADRGSDVGGSWEMEAERPTKTPDRWRHDSRPIREYVSLAETDGFRPTSVEQGRQVLIRYERFLRGRLARGLEGAGWKEYAAYRTHLARRRISRATLRCYLFSLTSFYRLRAQASQTPEHLDAYMRVRAVGVGRPARGRRWRPLNKGLLRLK